MILMISKKAAFYIASGAGISLVSISSLGANPPDLNEQLRSNVCTQRWGQAITVVDKMVKASPQNRNALLSYRRQLESIKASGQSIPVNQMPDCKGGSVAQPSPQSTPSKTPAGKIPKPSNLPWSGGWGNK